MYLRRVDVAGPSGLGRETEDSEYDHYPFRGRSTASSLPSMRRSSASSMPTSFPENAMKDFPHYPGVPIDTSVGAAENAISACASRRRVTESSYADKGTIEEPRWTGNLAWMPQRSLGEGLESSTGVRKGLAAAIVTAVETLTLCLAVAALGMDAWLAPTITSDRTLAGTKWAITHTRRAGLWTVCFDGGTSLLARDNPFYATAPFCSSAVSAFYKTQIYGVDLWLLVVTGQAVAVFFIGVTAVKLITGVALYFADTQRGPLGLQTLRRELSVGYAVGKITQPVLGYALLGLLISVLKQTEDFEYTTTHQVHNYAGRSFWIWLVATISVAIGVFISGIMPLSSPSESPPTPIHHNPRKPMTEQ